MSRCVNCNKVFEQGYNPMYCSERCALAKNAEVQPAIIDDGHAHVRAQHRQSQKAFVVAARPPLRRAW